jgi:pyruvate dehydrogenase E2 component (dihydrolipoamide acetyltransferase)
MTISSLGGIGGNFFTPIINPPEVAILGVGKTFDKIKKVNGQFIVRKMLPISLSYDHRVIDGAEGARFCVHLSKSLGKDFAFKLAV